MLNKMNFREKKIVKKMVKKYFLYLNIQENFKNLFVDYSLNNCTLDNSIFYLNEKFNVWF
jgi:hypothetical protein